MHMSDHRSSVANRDADTFCQPERTLPTAKTPDALIVIIFFRTLAFVLAVASRVHTAELDAARRTVRCPSSSLCYRLDDLRWTLSGMCRPDAGPLIRGRSRHAGQPHAGRLKRPRVYLALRFKLGPSITGYRAC